MYRGLGQIARNGPGGRGRRRRLGDRRKRSRRPRPGAQAGEKRGSNLVAGDIADRCDHRGVGPVVLTVERDHLLTSESRQRLHGANRRARIRMSRVQDLSQHAAGHRLGVLLVALESGADLAHLPLQLVLGEDRLEKHLGEEIQSEREVLLQHGQRHGCAVTPGIGVEASAHELDGPVQLGAGPPRGAASEELGGEVGEAGAIGGIEGGAGAHVHGDDHDGNRRPLGHQENRAVRQHLAVGVHRRLGGGPRGGGEKPAESQHDGHQWHGRDASRHGRSLSAPARGRPAAARSGPVEGCQRFSAPGESRRGPPAVRRRP